MDLSNEESSQYLLADACYPTLSCISCTFILSYEISEDEFKGSHSVFSYFFHLLSPEGEKDLQHKPRAWDSPILSGFGAETSHCAVKLLSYHCFSLLLLLSFSSHL